MISDDSLHASAKTVRVILVIPTADSRTARATDSVWQPSQSHLYLPYPAVVDVSRLLTASGNRHNLTRTYLIQL